MYGTLRRGGSNHALLARARFRGVARTPAAYTLFSLGAHPGMGGGGSTAVLGELFEVDDDTLRRLDALEGHPTWYRRVRITLEDGGPAETYLLPPRFTAGLPVIPSGDWMAWAADRAIG